MLVLLISYYMDILAIFNEPFIQIISDPMEKDPMLFLPRITCT